MFFAGRSLGLPFFDFGQNGEKLKYKFENALKGNPSGSL